MNTYAKTGGEGRPRAVAQNSTSPYQNGASLPPPANSNRLFVAYVRDAR